jgi:peptidyl-prolyl cis-trans isomerase B (cyclophilin B)
MSDGGKPDSAPAQFFINTKNNAYLDFTKQSGSGWGFCVFGRIIKGMDVVDAIEAVPTASKDTMRGAPVTPILITRAAVVKTAPE